MKNFSFILIMIVLIVAGCQKESANKKNNEENLCDTITCQNGGACVSGSCNCPPQFTGNNCQIPVHNYGVTGIYSVTAYHYNSGPPPGGGGNSYYTYNDTLQVTAVGTDSISTKLQIVNLGTTAYDTTSASAVKHFYNQWWAGGMVTYNMYFFENTPDSIHGKKNTQQLSNSSYVEYWGHKIQ